MWLDRGELDKILDRSSRDVAESSASTERLYGRSHRESSAERARDLGSHRERPASSRKSWLQELFD